MNRSASPPAISIATRLGPLNVQVIGSGPPALLWHSLFVDSTTWQRLRPALANDRRLVLIDGPNHGGNPRRRIRFSLIDCVGAAVDILDQLGIDEPVDWLGNAWGGHVGILFAAAHSDRCRTLTAIGTPVHALGFGERWQIRLLSALYLAGGARPVLRPLLKALIGPDAKVQDPAGAAIVTRSFSRAGRLGMFDAIRWLSLNRRDLTPVLGRLSTPTLFATAREDPLWTVPAARSAVGQLRHGMLAVLPGVGHIGPLLDRTPAAADLIKAFWRDPEATMAATRSGMAVGD